MITPKSTYLSRRTFLQALGLGGSLAATGVLYRKFLAPMRRGRMGEKIQTIVPSAQPSAPPLAEARTSYESITNYNNFYEFSTDKREVAYASRNFNTRPWAVEIDGLCAKPGTFDLDKILKLAPHEERVFRHRCVEGWSMVIPWVGFSLRHLLAAAEPLGSAKFVQFETLFDPERMPNQKADVLPWPYLEGYRIDEAMHPLATLAFGLYGETLPPQNGAPLRTVLPWKYGFKGCKSIVKIHFTEVTPNTTWNMYAPNEYGFYSNVNPLVSHPRWSQATERRIGEFGKRDTLMFNGYGDQVASLYTGMDLKANF
jgi:methionine sulfoxide reductase catalytic subunit